MDSHPQTTPTTSLASMTRFRTQRRPRTQLACGIRAPAEVRRKSGGPHLEEPSDATHARASQEGDCNPNPMGATTALMSPSSSFAASSEDFSRPLLRVQQRLVPASASNPLGYPGTRLRTRGWVGPSRSPKNHMNAMDSRGPWRPICPRP